jgi:transcriptional regulator GlxA family with amidase domain
VALLGVGADEIPLTAAPMAELADTPGAARAAETTAASSAPSVQVLMRALRLLAADRQPMADRQVAAVLRAMRARPGQPITRHADAVGLSERQLRRRFAVAVGLGPKSFAKVTRLHLAVSAARTALAGGIRPDWALIALQVGCYDQPHLLAEFRAALGCSPSVFLADGRFLQACGAAGRP